MTLHPYDAVRVTVPGEAPRDAWVDKVTPTAITIRLPGWAPSISMRIRRDEAEIEVLTGAERAIVDQRFYCEATT